MKYAYTLSCLFLLFVLPLKAQTINDCADAVIVCSNEALTFNPDGPGYDDYSDPDNQPGCITSLEQNSAWYYFQINPNAPPNLELGFVIHPNGGLGEDYDWALYGPDVNCGALGNPLRCSSSSAACGFCPETGLGMGTTDVTEGPGTGDGFVMLITVQPGQGFYLMIDNWLGTSNGFVLEWTEEAAPYLNCDAKPPCSLNADAGPDINTCEGEEGVLLNGSSTNGQGAEMYEWSGTNGGTAFLSDPNVADPTLDIPIGFNGIITYTLTVTEDTCVAEDMVDVYVNALPTVNINAAGPFCANNGPQILSATPPGGTWGGAATGNTFNPTSNGPGIHTVTYTYTDNNGCTNTDELDIEVFELPEPAIDPNPAEFCDSEGSILLTATSTGGQPGYEYVWNTPSGIDIGDTYDASVSGLYTVTVTDDNGCTSTATTTVTSYPNPEVEIIDPGPICVSLEYFSLNATPTGGEFSGSIIDINGDIIPNEHNPGIYQVSYSYTDNNNCTSVDYEDITIIPVPTAIPDNTGPVCAGQPFMLIGETDGTGASVTYSWSGPNGYVSNQQNPSNATEGGTYVLIVTIDNCPSEAATTIVTVHPVIEAFASNTGPYCFGETIQLYGSTNTSGNEITYAWSGPGGYTSFAQNPTDATAAGTYTLVVTVDDCASAPVQTDVVFSTPPNAQATNTGPYCVGEAIVLNGTTSSSGNVITYAWSGPGGYQSSAQNPLDATVPGLYQLIVDIDGCGSIPATTNVIVNALPQPVIAGQDTFCTGFSSILDAGASYQIYEWSNMASSQSIEVFSTGTYTVTVTDVNGCIGSTSLTVTELSSLMPVISGTLDFCDGGSTVIDAGNGYTNYQWSTGQSTQSITVSNGGTVGVIVTDSDGCTGSANVNVTEHANPVVIIGGSSTYCIGGYATLDAGPGYAQYLWSNDSTTQTLITSTPGIFSVSVTDINGCNGAASVTVTESTSLSPIITGTPAFCENESTTLNAGSGFATYDWSTGAVTQTVNVNIAGTYSVTVTDGQGCSGNSSVNVTEVLPPSATVSAGATLCNTTAGGSVINLYSLVTNGDMNGSWLDMDNSGAVGLFNNLNFNNVPAGDYRFEYTTNSANAPCTDISYITIITVLDCTCPDVFFHPVLPLCNASDVLDLTTIENTDEQGTWSILSTPPGSNPATLNGTSFNATAADPGDYSLQFTLVNQPPPGCPSDFEVTAHIDPSVTAGTALAPLSYCEGESAVVTLSTLLNGADAGGQWMETSPIPSQSGAFNPANGTFTINTQVAGNYSFRYSLLSAGVCPDDDETVQVSIHPLPIVTIAAPAILNCADPVQALNANGSSIGPEFMLSWNGPGILMDGNENTLRPNIDQAGTYTLTITNILTGCFAEASVNVLSNTDPPDGAALLIDHPSCNGTPDGIISVNQVIGGTPPYQYSLNNAPYTASSTFGQLAAGDHLLYLQDANGCRWDTTITLIEPQPVFINAGGDIEIGLGEQATVQAEVSIPPAQIDSIIWLPPGSVECLDIYCLQGIVHVANSTNLSATLIDVNGCEATDQVFILLNKNRKVYIPNAFSPNGDGINDKFFISADPDQVITIKAITIYSRWGEIVFATQNQDPNDENSGWDGRIKNEFVNPGVYVVYAEIEFIDGVTEFYTGDVTVVR
jgi:gliding motility-associated-like protein